MSRLLLNLRHVPEDEAEEVKGLLDEANIEWYETPVGRWGISLGGIWVRERDDMPRARELMHEYGQRRLAQAQADRAERARRGELENMVHWLVRDPLGVLARLLGVAAIIFLMLYPFFGTLSG